jgi:Aspartyl protease/PDZ domain
MRAFARAVAYVTALAAASAPAGAQNPSAADSALIDRILSAAHAAAGGAQLDAYAMLTEAGSLVQNGGPASAFKQVTDLRSGYTRAQLSVGPATYLQGYDGTDWSEVNGSLSIVSLPTFVADAVTQAYLSSNAYFRPDQRSTILSAQETTADGERAYLLRVEPAGGSPADLYFDAANYRLVKVVAHTADGTDTTTNSDFQPVQGVPVPMRSVEVDARGTTTTVTATSIAFAAASDPAALARPRYVSQGTLAVPTSVPFVSDALGGLGHIVVPVTLNGKRTSLIFDSGGSNLLVPTAVTRLGLTASGAMASGGAGAKGQMSAFARVESLDLGGARLANQNFTVTPLAYALLHNRKNVGVEGLVGYEYLANFRIVVQYARHLLDVMPFDSPSPSGGVTLPFKSDGQHAYVLAALDGISGYYILDTGNGGGIALNLPFVQEHHLFSGGGVTYVSPGGIGGGYHEVHAAAKSFEFAGRTFYDVPVVIPQVAAGFFATRGVAGNLGSAFLSRFTLAFDYKAQTVTLIPNRDVSMAFRSDRTGLSLNQDDAGAFVVRGVVAGSPAAGAGVESGDRITAFGRNAVSSGFGLGDLRPFLSGNKPFTLTIVRDGATRTVTIVPRAMLPAPQ